MDITLGLLQMFSNRDFGPRFIFFSDKVNNSTVSFDGPKNCFWKIEAFNPVSQHMTAKRLVKFQKPFAAVGPDQDFVEFHITCYE